MMTGVGASLGLYFASPKGVYEDLSKMASIGLRRCITWLLLASSGVRLTAYTMTRFRMAGVSLFLRNMVD